MGVIPCPSGPRKKAKQSGQAVVEYLLIVMVVVGIFVAIGRPAILRIAENLKKDMKGGFFSDENKGGFYYFPVK